MRDLGKIMKMVQMIFYLIHLIARMIIHQEFGGSVFLQCLSCSTFMLTKRFRRVFVVVNLKNSLDKFYLIYYLSLLAVRNYSVGEAEHFPPDSKFCTLRQ